MNQRHLLIVPMFLLIFGPKISGWIDTVSITSLCMVAIHCLWLNTAHVPVGAKSRTLLLGSVFGMLLTFAGGHYLTQFDPNAYQVLRFGRVLVNFLGVASLVSVYYRWFGDGAGQVVVRHLFHCLVLHALIMAGMFVSPSFRDLIVNQVVQADPDSRTYFAKATGYRIAGLTDSWDALSGLQSLGILMLPILLTRPSGLATAHAIVAMPALLFSVAISGRTGFVTLAILLPISLCFADLRRVHRATFVGGIAMALAAFLILGPLRGACVRALESSSLGRTVAIFGLDYRTSDHSQENIADTFSGIVAQHYFLPDSWRTLALGTGGSGRDGWDYVPADNGLVLNLHNLGLGCFVGIYGSLIWMFASSVRSRRVNPLAAGVATLAVSLILLIDAKVMYVYSRNGFSVMLLPVLTAWWEMSKHRSRTAAIPAPMWSDSVRGGACPSSVRPTFGSAA